MIDMEALQRAMESGGFREMRDSVPDGLENCSKQITSIIKELQAKYTLPANRVVIGGFSQGSMLTTGVALNFKEPLGGLIVWSGTLLNSDAWSAAAGNQAPLNVVVTHGTLDPILPFHGSEALRDLLIEKGHHVNFLRFIGQHEIPGEAIQLAAELIEACL